MWRWLYRARSIRSETDTRLCSSVKALQEEAEWSCSEDEDSVLRALAGCSNTVQGALSPPCYTETEPRLSF